MSNAVDEVTLNTSLVGAVIELIDFYSKKGVFKISEYKDIASINDRLTELKSQYENNKEVTQLNLNELSYIVQIFKEGTQRVPTSIDSFGQIYAIYQHFTKSLEQEVEKQKKAEEDSKVPTVEELNK